MLGNAVGPALAGAASPAVGSGAASPAAGGEATSNEGRGSLVEAVEALDGSEGGGGMDAMVGLALAEG
jgi:hypothetical protein